MKKEKNYPVNIEIQIAWGEMDAFGHVNNTIYFKYFESVRIKYFEKIGLLAMMEETGIGPILAETKCSFKKPLTYPGCITVGARIRSAESSSFIMEYCITDSGGNITALGEAVMVVYDYNKKSKAAITEEIKKTINSLEGKEAV